ncbi:MAG: hypothetical protein IPJ74_25220 [Saprospiraceae bacterium]|nr:hypothetical protein [Saprospiraceae bacterium]
MQKRKKNNKVDDFVSEMSTSFRPFEKKTFRICSQISTKHPCRVVRRKAIITQLLHRLEEAAFGSVRHSLLNPFDRVKAANIKPTIAAQSGRYETRDQGRFG